MRFFRATPRQTAYGAFRARALGPAASLALRASIRFPALARRWLTVLVAPLASRPLAATPARKPHIAPLAARFPISRETAGPVPASSPLKCIGVDAAPAPPAQIRLPRKIACIAARRFLPPSRRFRALSSPVRSFAERRKVVAIFPAKRDTARRTPRL